MGSRLPTARSFVANAAHLCLGLFAGFGFVGLSLVDAGWCVVHSAGAHPRTVGPLARGVRVAEAARYSAVLGEQGVVGRPDSMTDTEQVRRIRAYALLRLPLSLVHAFVFVATLIAPSVAAALVVASAVLRWTNPGVGVRYLVGLLGLLAAPALFSWLTRLDVALAASLLGGDRARLESTVSALVASRLRDQDAVQSEREQLERDLHDGAQQHLIALSAQLGRLERSMERRSAAAADLAQVRQSRMDAVAVVAEIRALARGLRPHLLEARGLGVALQTVAARLPIPTLVDVDLPDRPSPAMERTLYLACCELVTNASKHSGAATASVHIRQEGNRVVATIEDDGRGGAIPEPGGGLSGVAQRIQESGGAMTVSSPAGGPTLIRLEAPCV